MLRRNWEKPDCWFEPECFSLKDGEFGPQIKGGRRPPHNRADGLVGDTFFGYPAFYVRNHLVGRDKWDVRSYNLTVFEKFASLPVRSWKSPYLLFFKPTFCGWDRVCPPLIEHLINNRTDIIWIGHDLGGMKLQHPGLTIPGVTIPGELASSVYHAWRYKGRPRYPHKNFLTFQGKCPSRKHAHQWYMNYSVRGELNRLFNVVNEDNYGWDPRPGLPEGVIFSCSAKQKGRYSSAERRRMYYNILDTDYALIPRGDERWSFRFLEAVGAGAVPVIVADGLTLPLEHLIDWDNIVIRIPEAAVVAMKDYTEFLPWLPTGTELRVRYEAIRMLNARYFADGDTLVWAFDLAITRYIETRQRFKWKNRVDEDQEDINRDLGLMPPFRHQRWETKEIVERKSSLSSWFTAWFHK